MADKYIHSSEARDQPPRSGFVITPHDTNDIDTTRSIWLGGPGNLAVIYMDDTASVTLYNVPAGRWVGSVTRVLATGTTATQLVGEY